MSKLQAICCFLFFSSYVFAQETFEEIEISLPTGIRDMRCDHIGQVYLLTKNNVYRFGGDELEAILPIDSKNKSIHVISLIDDEIWFQEQEQIKRWSITKDQVLDSIDFPHKLISVYKKAPNEFIIAKQGGGILTYGIEKGEIVELPQTSSIIVNDFLQLNKKVYLASDDGIYMMNSSHVKPLISSSQLPDYIISQLVSDGITIYGRSYDGSLFTINPKSNEIKVVDTSINENINNIYTIDGKLLVSTDRGVFQFQEKQGNFSRQKIDNKPAKKIMEDPQQNLWCLTEKNTLAKNHPFQEIIKKLEPKTSHCLYTKNGIEIFEGSKNSILTYNWSQQNQLSELELGPKSHPTKIVAYKHNYVVATMGDGLFLISPNGKILDKISEQNGLNNQSILSLEIDNQFAWLITLGGITKIDLDNFSVSKNFTSKDGLPDTFFYDLEIEKNRILLATDGMGLWSWSPKDGVADSIDLGIKNAIIYDIETNQDKTWVSVENEGLIKLEKNIVLKQWNESNGLFSNRILDIHLDEKYIVLVYEFGVDVFEKSTQFIFPIRWQSEEKLDLHSSFLNDRFLFIGLNHEILRFEIDKAITKPNIRLYEPNHEYRSLHKNKNKFRNDDNSFEFRYEGVWNSAPEQIIYAYKLNEDDAEWSYTKEKRTYFNNLRHGDYKFEVGSVLSKGVPPADTQSYSFSIQKPILHRPISWLAIALVSSLVFFTVQKNREKRLKREKEAALSKLQLEYSNLKNQVNPHFLYNTFNSLSSLIDQDSKAANEYLTMLTSFLRKTLTTKPSSLIALTKELDMVKDYVALQSIRFHPNLSVDFRLEKAKEVKVIPMSIQTLVENAIKHNVINKKHPLLIEIYFEDDYIVVKNKIQKKKGSSISTGIGLKNINEQYIYLCEKPIIIEESGNTFKVKLPIIVNV